MDLILFYANGQTFRFGQVTNLKMDSDKVEFDYYGESTKTYRHACFIGIVGYSTENKPVMRQEVNHDNSNGVRYSAQERNV